MDSAYFPFFPLSYQFWFPFPSLLKEDEIMLVIKVAYSVLV